MPGSKPQLHHLFAEYSLEIHLTFLRLGFLMCKVSNSRTYFILLLLKIKLGNICKFLRIVFINFIAVVITT